MMGPSIQSLEIMEVLNKFGVPATFFWIYEFFDKFADKKLLLKYVRDGGHEIGLHATYDTHPAIWQRATSVESHQQLKRTKIILETQIDQKIRFFRPHYMLQPTILISAIFLGMKPILGSQYCYADPLLTVDEQITRFCKAKNKATLVFHEGETSHRCMSKILEVLPPVLSFFVRKSISIGKL